ncbi:MAG: tRNA pseudouridine(38-40) synthase TruA [Clostridia bacterium]|nr:tRNA pseudouridine(38-40) synthase TruA [Clostridia bacterium]
MKYLLKIAYIGTDYCGFQAQNNGRSIQRVLTEAAGKIFAVPTRVTGCSRTDSGVHALEYYITLEPSEGASSVKVENIPRAMCSVLPEDVGVLDARVVDDSFHPRYSAKGKEYKYLIYTSPARDPFFSSRAWMHYMRVGDAELENMKRAAARFVGEHDFTSFMSAGSSITDAVREVFAFDVEMNGHVLELKVSANGFLYNMVRIMAGTIAAVGEGRLSPDDIPGIIEARDRSRAGVTAPPEGLYLNRVFY